MARRRRGQLNGEDPNDPEGTSTSRSHHHTSGNSSSTLSKYALFIATIFLFSLYLYAKLRPKNGTKLNNKRQDIKSIYQLTPPLHEEEYFVHILMTGTTTSSKSTGFVHISEKIIQEIILQNYEKLSIEKKPQNLYFLLSSRLTTEEFYTSTTGMNASSSSSSEATNMAINRKEHTVNILSLLLQSIPLEQIYDESIVTHNQNLLTSLIVLIKFLDGLRSELIKLSRRRTLSSSIHVIFYVPDFHVKIYQHIFNTLLGLIPSLQSIVVSHIEILSTKDVLWSSPSIFQTIVTEYSESKQIKEVDEIMTWNKIKTLSDLERYLILGGKKKIKYC